jgi:hypothetical protein
MKLLELTGTNVFSAEDRRKEVKVPERYKREEKGREKGTKIKN